MLELQNTFPELELRETGELIFNTFIFLHFVLLFCIQWRIFFQITQDVFLLLFLFHCLLLNQYPSTYGRRFLDLKPEDLLSIGLVLQTEICA